PNEPIVLDLWPRDRESSCYADMTRTFVIGEPSEELAAYHKHVHEALERSVEAVKPGVAGRDVYVLASELFHEAGYPTGLHTRHACSRSAGRRSSASRASRLRADDVHAERPQRELHPRSDVGGSRALLRRARSAARRAVGVPEPEHVRLDRVLDVRRLLALARDLRDPRRDDEARRDAVR